MSRFLKSNYHYFLIVAFSLLCYHFLWLNAYSMKWDLAEQYLPWRYFVGKCISNSTLPYWNPFQLGGYPAYSDPQSATWYYPAWIIGSTFGYSMKIIQLEVLSFITLGGLGFFMLSKKIGNSTNSSFFFSLSYLSSGFFVGNAQHLTWIAAAAWIPWLFYHYLYIRKESYNLHVLWFLLILYLFASSAYPAFLIISAYIIIIDQVVLFAKSSNKKQFFLQKLLLVFLCIIALLPILYSTLSSMSYFSRGAGITLEKALQHPFTWQSLLSLIAPFSSFKNPTLFNTDISMANAYVGLLPLILLLTYSVSKKNSKSNFWLIIAGVFLLISIGSQLPIREFLFHYVPGFNLFRFPSLFRLFFIISLLLFAASYYDILKIYIEKYRRKIVALIVITVSIFIGIIVYYISSWKPFEITSINTLATQYEQSTFEQHLIYQLAFQSVLLLSFCLLLYKKIGHFFLLTFICVDLFMSVRLNAMATMVVNTKTEDVDKLIPKNQHSFNVPKFQALANVIDQQYEYRWPLNWNMNCYYGELAIDGYNPFVLNSFNLLENSTIKDSVWQNAWLYFPSKIMYADESPSLNASEAWIQSSKTSEENYYTKPIIDTIQFKPNQIKLTYNSDSAFALVLAQNPFPGWKSSIDNVETSIYTCNFAQQLIKLPAGNHTLEFKFENNLLKYINLIHLILFAFTMLFACINSLKGIKNSY